jgi:cytochrome c oxidase subunit 1
MLGVTLLSFMVWQHHLFVSGMNAGLRPFYMLTTELISIPTGFIFLIAIGTLWRARIRFTVPMLFALAFFFNFLIGGLSGVFLSDVPSDVTTHGSYFVMAHFHYTIVGGLVFAFFGAVYYWLPKMLGFELNETLGKIHFWLFFVFFNLTFFPLFAAGFLDMPRRVSTYAPSLQTLNIFVSASAYVIGLSMLIFIANLVWSLVFVRQPAAENPWASRGLEWQVPTPVPVSNFDRVPVITSGPYEYGVPNAPPVADFAPGALPAAVGLQCAQFSSLGFGPTDGAYGSVFVGWSGLFAVFLLGTCYWLATVIGDVTRAGGVPVVRAAAVEGVGFVLLVLAGVEIAAFILLYVVK